MIAMVSGVFATAQLTLVASMVVTVALRRRAVSYTHLTLPTIYSV